MEGSGTGISRLDCYEDMFKEITRKLYGEDPDHRTSSVQNEFETSVSYKTEDDTENGTDGSDDGNWTCEDEPLKGTNGSRIAAYNAEKATWRCHECAEVMGGGPRDAAEHFMELHSSRILVDDDTNRHHSPRKDYLQTDFKVEDVILYLERVRERAERAAPPSRRTQETQTVPAALLPMTSSFFLQELPSTPTSQHLHQNTATMSASPTTLVSSKRYTCPYCPYGTDRRDLYTRHENIHREEKPFHCYVCCKPFNRADHVKKHFLRMHREHCYELSRIRRPPGTSTPKPLQQESGAAAAANATANTNGQQPQQQQQQQQQQPQQQQHTSYQSSFASNKGYQLQPNAGSGTGTTAIYQATTMPSPGIMQPDATNCATVRRVQNSGCNSKSHLKGGAKSAQERRYTCCYCSWSGVDNWCLKRHLNTHLKPYACTLCEYKAARPERLATHVFKVHNRRQCAKCSFLAEDLSQLQMHMVHVHRLSGTNAPATSTTQVTPPPNNRHQQPLHPVGGGRPPPGPPVFPAPAPAIAPTTTVIPPTTILGHEMVNSPATAATMAYPTEEEKRPCGDDDDDNSAVVQGNGNRGERNRDFGACHVCDFKSDNRNDGPCSVHSNVINRDDYATVISNSDFTCSYRFGLEKESGDGQPSSISPDFGSRCAIGGEKDQRRGPSERRSRKQSQPRKAIPNLESEEDEPVPIVSLQDYTYALTGTAADSMNIGKPVKICEPRWKRSLLKCYSCPKNVPARGLNHRAYHTATSLILHKLWKHKQNSKDRMKPVFNMNLPSAVSSITLKATVFTSPNYAYQR